MSIYKSAQWSADIAEVLETLPELRALENKTVFISGATGLICSAVVDILIFYNEWNEAKIKILAAGRSQEKIKARFAKYADRTYFSFVPYNALGYELHLDIPCDYIIHGAGNAFPLVIMKEPVETILSNVCGLEQLLQHARQYNTKRVLYISSSEVYGNTGKNIPFKEEDYGYIDLLNPRNSYSVSKRAAETLCISYAAEYGTETVIVRPGHIYGPTATLTDNRVSSAWAYAAARGEDIVMKSDGSQLRSYCYCLDCASAILKILLKGKNGNAYNISNPRSVITIKEMAKLLAETGGVNLLREKAGEQEKRGFNPMQNSSLDSTKLQELGWKGCFSAKEGLSHTVAILRERIEAE